MSHEFLEQPRGPNRTLKGKIGALIILSSDARCFVEQSEKAISATTDEEAGEPKAKPRLNRNALTRMMYGLSKCVRPRIVRQIAIETCHRFTPHKIFLRSTMSASAPAGNVNSANGRAETVDISEIRKAESPVVPKTEKAAVL
jgi:hypothetical protein